jgi:hypothetical protein
VATGNPDAGRSFLAAQNLNLKILSLPSLMMVMMMMMMTLNVYFVVIHFLKTNEENEGSSAHNARSKVRWELREC